MEFITKGAEETKAVGKKIADLLNSRNLPFDNNESSVIFALSGEMGSGKTTFVQGLAQGLGIKQRIVSPTFIIVRTYEIQYKPRFNRFHHIDLYRLEENIESELTNLGVDEIWKESGNLAVIEWAEKAKDYLPGNTYNLHFETLGEYSRKIILKVPRAYAEGISRKEINIK